MNDKMFKHLILIYRFSVVELHFETFKQEPVLVLAFFHKRFIF